MNDTPHAHGASHGSAERRVFLHVRDVHKRFAGVHALRGISLTIEAGEIYHLLGENGCGKSTLIKIISGAQPPSQGDLVVDGVAHAELSPLQALTLGIETVYQDLSLLPNMSVAENVALSEQLVHTGGRLARRFDRAAVAATARRALATVNLPTDDDFLATRVGELPLATRQLLAIARAIATRARMVIMDEPTTSLTQKEVDNLVRVVEGLRASGVAVLFVSHKLDECFAIGGQAIVFRDGAKVTQGPIQNFTKAELSHWMTGKQLDGARYRQQSHSHVPLLRVDKLGHGQAFADVSFELHKGEILGITGLLDSGRNELALALAGVQAADAGRITLGAESIALKTPRDAIQHGIGYVPEDRINEGLFLDKSIRDNIVTVVLNRLRGRTGALDAKKCQTLADATIQNLQIATPDVDRAVQSLSGGNQQRVLIGRWLAIQPRVLILHGPTVGVDVGSKDTIYRIIQKLADDGLGVILVSDDLPELLQNCDRIMMMSKGRVTQTFDAEGLDESELYRTLVSDNSSITTP
ncbi:monosaccharide ABC transporter ATP-binding protein, CUT2 family (TC 3.A.1.2.-) [Rhodoferax sp. OV413]|uniref:sugar ABC transporter ATP-binding protein n=1 Tax=Rhodoferax sp. OV413 TaxID=1855285 RepID=UPI00088C88CF|nr:sugar ABC transporter ATP-binding protein [Rhodoferax sp. OV413]SDP60889.1 monosaccharide ABC transporter ATP-binding protein, CUT2 family (TC 3.A.1.2.-) [Rhodoferax sp. OV413]